MVEPRYPNFSVKRDVGFNTLSAGKAYIDEIINPVVQTSSSNNGIQFNNIQIQEKLDAHRNFMLNQTIAQLTAGDPLPTFPSGRTITFYNMTAATTIDIYVTEGYPDSSSATIIPGGSAVAPGDNVVWNIPTTAGWNGNFTAFPTGDPSLPGATLAEFGLNQLWSGFVPPLRDTFDISTVPPGIGTLCNGGPHGFPPPFPPKPTTNPNCVYYSLQSGFSTQQSYGYNIGIEIIPPAGSLASQTVICTSPNGDSDNSIGFPLDTAYPKQQTIELTGNYTVNFLDPVVSLP
jgi:hypothetical protein